MGNLTFKQRLFVAAYLGESNGNATDAARQAGYGSPNTAGPRLLVNASIQAAIETRLEGAALSSNEVLARISELATGTLGDFIEIDDDDKWKLSLRKARRLRKLGLIKKLKLTKDGATEIELHDPLVALEKLAKYHGLDARTAIQAEQNRELKERIEAIEVARESGVKGLPPRSQPSQTD